MWGNVSGVIFLFKSRDTFVGRELKEMPMECDFKRLETAELLLMNDEQWMGCEEMFTFKSLGVKKLSNDHLLISFFVNLKINSTDIGNFKG